VKQYITWGVKKMKGGGGNPEKTTRISTGGERLLNIKKD